MRHPSSSVHTASDVPAAAAGDPTADPAGDPAGDRRAAVVAAAVILVGIALRGRQFAHGRPLWLDELFLALNVTTRSFAGLAEPLAWDQSAPVLFLWLERLALLLGGHSERALRTPSLVAGCALLPLLWVIGRRVIGREPALLALGFAALSPYLIYFSNELKPYMVDGMVTLALVALTLRLLDRPDDRARWTALATAGVLALPLSSPAIFTLGAVSMALLAQPAVRARAAGPVVAMGALWLATFAAVYLLFLHPVASNTYLRVWFSDAFLVPSAPDFAPRLARAAGQMTLPPLHGSIGWVSGYFPIVVAAIAAVGAVTAWRRCGLAVALLLVLPALGAVAASALERYPVVARTMLFAAPLTLLLVAGGIFAIAEVAGRAMTRPIAWTIGGALALPALITNVQQAANPVVRQDIRPAIARLLHPANAGDPLYISRRARSAWGFYSTDWRRPDARYLAWLEQAGSEAPRPDEWDAPAGAAAADSNIRRVHGRVEIIQRYPVSWVRPPGRAIDTLPLARWAESEALRLRRASSGVAWIFAVAPGASSNRLLLRSVRRNGGRVAKVVGDADVILYRVEFEGAAAARNSRLAAPDTEPR